MKKKDIIVAQAALILKHEDLLARKDIEIDELQAQILGLEAQNASNYDRAHGRLVDAIKLIRSAVPGLTIKESRNLVAEIVETWTGNHTMYEEFGTFDAAALYKNLQTHGMTMANARAPEAAVKPAKG